jgi:hypothetical protein
VSVRSVFKKTEIHYIQIKTAKIGANGGLSKITETLEKTFLFTPKNKISFFVI